jgi:hypothetical protein
LVRAPAASAAARAAVSTRSLEEGERTVPPIPTIRGDGRSDACDIEACSGPLPSFED